MISVVISSSMSIFIQGVQAPRSSKNRKCASVKINFFFRFRFSFCLYFIFCKDSPLDLFLNPLLPKKIFNNVGINQQLLPYVKYVTAMATTDHLSSRAKAFKGKHLHSLQGFCPAKCLPTCMWSVRGKHSNTITSKVISHNSREFLNYTIAFFFPGKTNLIEIDFF